jgi:hypothetical protein
MNRSYIEEKNAKVDCRLYTLDHKFLIIKIKNHMFEITNMVYCNRQGGEIQHLTSKRPPENMI